MGLSVCKTIVLLEQYEKGILRHCKHCAVCEKFKTEWIKFEKLHFSSPRQLMEFISMDLIGEFYPPPSKGHQYALTVMDMLTDFVFCSPIKKENGQKRSSKLIWMKFITDLEDPGKSYQTMAWNLKTRYLKKCQKNSDVKWGLTHLHTNHSRMVRLNASINSWKPVWANISVKIWSEMMSWLQQPTIFSHIHQARKGHSSLCLARIC